VRAKLQPGDDVALGLVTLSIHTSASYARGIDNHPRFLRTLEDEITRSRAFNHELAVLLLSAEGPRDQQAFNAWCPRLRQSVRPVDRVALRSSGTVEILMPEAGRAAALRLLQQIGELAPPLRCGIALFPSTAQSAEQLLEAAEAARARAAPGQPQIASGAPAPPVTWWRRPRPGSDRGLGRVDANAG